MNEIEKAIKVLELEKKKRYDLLDAMPPKSRDRVIATVAMIKACEFAISALEAQQADRWIPITERLPDADGQYFATIKNLTGYAPLKNNVIFCRFDYGDWYFEGWEDNKVIAWKPLPEPWKEVD